MTNGSRTWCHLLWCFNPRAPWSTTAQNLQLQTNYVRNARKRIVNPRVNGLGLQLGCAYMTGASAFHKDTIRRLACRLLNHSRAQSASSFRNRQSNVLSLKATRPWLIPVLGLPFAGDVPMYSQPIPVPGEISARSAGFRLRTAGHLWFCAGFYGSFELSVFHQEVIASCFLSRDPRMASFPQGTCTGGKSRGNIGETVRHHSSISPWPGLNSAR